MVALDQSAIFDTPRNLFRKFHLPNQRPRIGLAGAIGIVALAIVLASVLVRGFTDNGFRLGTEMAWRFDCLVFFAALVAGPIGRLVPWLRGLADQGRPLVQGFCAGLGVYFASIVAPNLAFVSDGVDHLGITSGMTVFVLFTGSITLVMAAASNKALCVHVGNKACRALLGISAIYFWLCYALIGLAHISGPHRPDSFYGVSISLMVLGLLVRFADRYASAHRAEEPRMSVETRAA